MARSKKPSPDGKGSDKGIKERLQAADRVRARGNIERALELVREAANLMFDSGRENEAIDLVTHERDYASAATFAEKKKDYKRAAQLWFRGGDFLRAAKARLENGELMLAAELFERVGEHAHAAEIYEHEGDLVRASSLYERAGQKQRAADLLVRALSGSGRPIAGREAEDACRRAGYLYAEVGHVEFAVRVLRWGGQLAFAGQLLARVGRHAEAIDLLAEYGDLLGAAELARATGNEKKAQILLAARDEREGRFAEAAARFEQAEMYLEAARLYEYAGQTPFAAEAYERGGQLDSARELYEQLGRVEDAARCLRTLGREADAARLFVGQGAGADDTIRGLVATGDALRAAELLVACARAGDLQRYQEAAMLLNQLGPDRPEYLRARTMIAEIVFEQGDHRTAISVLHELISGVQVGHEHLQALYQYGRLLELEGYLAQARDAYRVALALDPGFRDIAQRMTFLQPTDSSSMMRMPWVGTVAGAPMNVPSANVPTAPMVTGPLVAAPSTVQASIIPEGYVLAEPIAQAMPVLEAGPVLESRPALEVRPSVKAMPVLEAKPRRKKGPPPPPPADPMEKMAEALVEDVERLDAEERAEAAQQTARPASLTGVVLRSRFRIEKKIGKGAQAEVYLARDLVLDRPVAIKVLNEFVAEDEHALQRFLREARLAARVHHSSCIAIFDFGQEAGLTFMAMEYFPGDTLREHLKDAPIQVDKALRITLQVAEALSAVHKAGIVHRDVKPTNVMIDSAGNARLADFGVAKGAADDRSHDTAGLMVGTMKYMSPEQARGKDADGRSDIFSLGVVLFEMLSGRAAFGATLDALIKRVTDPPPKLPDDVRVPDEVRRIVHRCMQRKRESRYPTVEPLIADLRKCLDEVARHDAENTKSSDQNTRAEPSSI